MYPSINLGPFVLPTAPAVYLLGIWLALSAVERAAKWLKQDAEWAYGVAATAVLVGFIGARLSFVYIYWAAFRENLLGIVWPLNTGYHIGGGVILGIAAAFFYGRAKQLPLAQTLDVLIPGLIIGLMAVSIADFLAGPGYGTLTNMPWGISQYGVRRHPVQLYETAVGAVALFIWWRTSQLRLFNGQLFLITLATHSAGRLFVEAYRDNAWVTANGYHIVQIISLISLLASLILLARFSPIERKPKH